MKDMNEQDIKKLHESLYEYLMSIHAVNKGFKFRVRRMNNQVRLERGYWFNGNDSYLETSFWDYKDNLHQTPVIRLVYIFKSQNWLCELVGRDSDERGKYFDTMAQVLGGFEKKDNMSVWSKELGNDFVNTIKKFIDTQKKDIDIYLNKNKNEKIVRLIEEETFNKDIQKIDSWRNKTIQLISNKLLDKRLPYSLKYLQINNFQGITKKLELGSDSDDAIANAQWIFLTGENGFGKTSILKTIAIGLTKDENSILNNEVNYEGFISARENKELPYEYDFKPIEKGENTFKIVGYGISRFNTIPVTAEESFKNSGNTYSLLSESGVLLNIERSLLDAFKEQEIEINSGKKVTTYANIISVFEIIIPKLLVKVERFEGETISKLWQVRYYEKDENGKIYEDSNGKDISVKLSDLASGYRGIFMMMGDMLIRLSRNFKDSLENLCGIALIDEFDAHLHPKYQFELPKLLSDAFPKVQFIVSTHSPIPLLGLPNKNKQGKVVNSVVFKVKRTAEEGITVDRLDDDIDIHRLSANALLTSEIFGFDNIFARDATPDTIEAFDSYTKIKEKKDLELLLELKQGFKDLNIKI